MIMLALKRMIIMIMLAPKRMIIMITVTLKRMIIIMVVPKRVIMKPCQRNTNLPAATDLGLCLL